MPAIVQIFLFVAINCGSLPKELIESELFGYVPGAFTGASKNGQPGKFELANGGTIFLDEIGDMPLALQVSLLRVLQTKTITRLGDTHERKLMYGLSLPPMLTLMEAVHNQTFRSDLYYRLNVLSIEVPPLRERKTDIPDLIHHFIAEKAGILRKTSQKSVLLLSKHYAVIHGPEISGNWKTSLSVL
ncbi:MAG: sigma 54-interacting transcriptional regulator [Eubacterium ramulus]